MKTELTTCGETGTYGLIVWLNTKKEKLAESKAKILVDKLNKKKSKAKK